MRDLKTFELKNEKPTRKGQPIEIPSFMIPQQQEEVNDRLTVKDYIRLLALAGIVWFFCYLDNNVMVGLIGTIASTAVLCLTGGDGSAVD